MPWLWLKWFSKLLGVRKHLLPECSGNDAFVQMSWKSCGCLKEGEGPCSGFAAAIPAISWVFWDQGCSVLHSPVTFPLPQRGTGAALLLEESHPFPSSSRRMESFQTGKLPGLQWWFWFLKSCVPVLSMGLKWVCLLRLLPKIESQSHLVPLGGGTVTWIFSPFRSGVWGWFCSLASGLSLSL